MVVDAPDMPRRKGNPEALAKAREAKRQKADEFETLKAQIAELETKLGSTDNAGEQGALIQRLDRLIERFDVMNPAKPHQRPDDPPGTIYDAGTLRARKKSWRYADLAPGKCEWKEFTPNETLPVTWNGLRWQLKADEPFRGPEVVYGVYMDYKANKKFAAEHARYLMKKGPATHRDMRNPQTESVRGYADGGNIIVGWTPDEGREAPDATGAEEGAGGES